MCDFVTVVAKSARASFKIHSFCDVGNEIRINLFKGKNRNKKKLVARKILKY